MSQCGLNGVSVCRDLMEAIVLATEKFPEKEIFFIGGGEIYEQTIDIVSEIHLSIFSENCCDECDAYFPSINYDLFDVVSRKKSWSLYTSIDFKYLDQVLYLSFCLLFIR